MLEDIEARLRAQSDNPFVEIGTAMDLAAVLKTPPQRSPVAFVYPLSAAGKPRQVANRGRQQISQGFGVEIFLRRLGDARGQGKSAELEPLYLWVRKTLIGWEPPGHTPIEFMRAGLDAMTNGTAFWSEEFVTSYHHRTA